MAIRYSSQELRAKLAAAGVDTPNTMTYNQLVYLATREGLIAQETSGTGGTGATGPRGPRGERGLQGTQGIQGVAGTNGTNGTNGTDGTDGTNGTNGTNGAAATITVGTVSTGVAGSTVTFTNSGTTSAAVFDVSIPRGDTGAAGATGGTGPAGQGVPTGGTAGQVLSKIDSTNYNTQWVAQSGGMSGFNIIGATGTPIAVSNATNVAITPQVGTPLSIHGSGTTLQFSFVASGVTAGSYTNADITVDEFGRVTAAANGSGGGGSYTDAQAIAAVEGEATLDLTGETTFGQAPLDLAAVDVTYSSGSNVVVVPDGSVFSLGDKIKTTALVVLDSSGNAIAPSKGVLITAIAGNNITLTKTIGASAVVSTVFRRERGKCLKMPASPYLYSNPVSSDEELKLFSDKTGTNAALLRIQSATGYLRIGAQNTSYCHFYTDRAYFYFNKAIQMDGGGAFYAYNDDLMLKTDDSGSTQPTRIHISGGIDECRVGIGAFAHTTDEPQQVLHVKGTARLDQLSDIVGMSGSKSILGTDANGDIIGGGLSIRDEGTPLGNANSVTQFNFVGAGVVASRPSATDPVVTVTVAGGGGGGGPTTAMLTTTHPASCAQAGQTVTTTGANHQIAYCIAAQHNPAQVITFTTPTVDGARLTIYSLTSFGNGNNMFVAFAAPVMTPIIGMTPPNHLFTLASFSVVTLVYKTGSIIDPNGEPIVPAVDGWHIECSENLRTGNSAGFSA